MKYFRKESKPLTLTTGDYLLRCGGVENDDGSFSVCLINRHPEPVDVELSLEGLTARRPLRNYLYDANQVPHSDFADLQDYRELLPAENGLVKVTLPGSSIAMLTTDYREHKPAPVGNVRFEEGRITWDASAEPEHRYYRVYKGSSESFTPSAENQIASTIALYARDDSGVPGCYKVLSMDQWGNC